MSYSSLADLLLVLHLGFILFVIFGGLLVRWKRVWAWVHLPVLAWGAAITLCGWICPLTPLEQRLRTAAGEQAYAGGFIDHYLVAIIYPPGLNRMTQVGLGLLLLLGNILVYWSAFRRQQLPANTEK
ncbi:MAG: DUF2784 domain-containing protein [Gammaproteobacteria bacterium]